MKTGRNHSRRENRNHQVGVRIPETEKALLQSALEWPGTKIWTTTRGNGELAKALARERFDARILVWTLDAFQADRLQSDELPNLRIHCEADWPDESCDLVLLPLDPHGEKELVRETIQSAYKMLALGGILAIALQAKSEAWGREQMKVFSKALHLKHHANNMIVLHVVKSSELKKEKDFRCDMAFRDQGNLIPFQTRPGVFAHRKIDLGARQLLNFVNLDAGCHALDIGCGAGTVTIGLASRDPTIRVTAIDSNPRAVQLTQQNASLNNLSNIEAFLNHDDTFRAQELCDVAVANPPYFSNFKIAEIFCVNAHANLRSGGHAVFVTKQIQWYVENFGRWFENVDIAESSSYKIVFGQKV
ncbi:MAG: methyltransferase [Pirellulaceae bacterium]